MLSNKEVQEVINYWDAVVTHDYIKNYGKI